MVLMGEGINPSYLIKSKHLVNDFFISPKAFIIKSVHNSAQLLISNFSYHGLTQNLESPFYFAHLKNTLSTLFAISMYICVCV